MTEDQARTVEQILARLEELAAQEAAEETTPSPSPPAPPPPEPPAAAKYQFGGVLIGSTLSVIGVLATTVITVTTNDPTPVDCIDERTKAVALIAVETDWNDLDEDSPVEKQCSINEYVGLLKN